MDWIEKTSCEIVRLYNPEKIILFSRKTGLTGEVSSFKLCVVAHTQDKRALELDIYLSVDCDVPFDVLVYRPDEWDAYRTQADTFASTIERTGRVLHG